MTSIITVHNAADVTPQPRSPQFTPLRKPWSHGRAYGPIAIICVLVLLSLSHVILHQMGRTWLKPAKRFQ
ncbi:hypothetical protein IQ268_23580 [Oculatella sp. LEGE 06141]|uniref:hypothetical protein n=1 Tax=Oculatella sp. LEGE 06141 TaxID=1828648 RepID=UPI0018806731|nr:hypothetical protein [Oculatella sp. LEGE 06141]MBE9181548.1 hypothetical protein [Oculatella sp. LEGE 06141]